MLLYFDFMLTYSDSGHFTARLRLSKVDGWLEVTYLGERTGNLLLLPWREDLPESESLIPSPSDHSLAVRTDGQVKYSERVACQHGNLLHPRLLLPYDYLVLRVTMSAHQLVHVLTVLQIAHLAASVDEIERFTGEAVPESNASVGSSATRAHHTMLMRRPSDRLHSSLVLTELDLSLRVVVTGPNQ